MLIIYFSDCLSASKGQAIWKRKFPDLYQKLNYIIPLPSVVYRELLIDT